MKVHRRLLVFVRNASFIFSLLLIFTYGGYLYGQEKIAVNPEARDPRDIVVVNREQPIKHQDVDFSLFWKVWDQLEKSYIDPRSLDPEKMVYGAISGMTSALGDPYTVFLPPEDNKQSKENLSGSFFGVGIQIGFRERRLAVIAPLEGMPAQKAGVEAGDFILRIKDERKGVDRNTEDISLPEAVSLIRGEQNTQVVLELGREGLEEPEEVVLTRAEIIIPSVELEFLPISVEGGKEGEVAHLRLMQFGDRTQKEWDEIVEKIRTKAGLIGVVLDMRNNPGGFLNGSVDIASEFISDGTIVVQQGRDESKTFRVSKRGKLIGIPTVVLINGGSASASEIVAGALRDRVEVRLVGEKTFGKGTVQVLRDLPFGAGLHVTTSKWILPSGQAINDKGLSPDVEVVLEDEEEGEEEVDEQLERAIEELVG